MTDWVNEILTASGYEASGGQHFFKFMVGARFIVPVVFREKMNQDIIMRLPRPQKTRSRNDGLG